MELLIATRSAGKLREIRRILADVPDLRVLGPDEAGIPYDPVEEGLEPYATFEENAASKAGYFFERSGLATVADDSGLEVDALGGAPGVRSKRFAPDRGLDGQPLDDANNAHLLSSLDGVAPEARTARYVCVAVLVEPGREPEIFRGTAEAVVGSSARGDGGFGYDPIMVVPGSARTYAELEPREKDARSHRGEAFRAVADHLRGRATTSPTGGAEG